jgi:hypothetical protein
VAHRDSSEEEGEDARQLERVRQRVGEQGGYEEEGQLGVPEGARRGVSGRPWHRSPRASKLWQGGV